MAAIWGRLKTIGAMQEYQEHNIENHPSILGKYTQFFIANKGGSDSDSNDTDSNVKVLEEKIESVKKVALGASAAVVTASYKVDELKRKNNLK